MRLCMSVAILAQLRLTPAMYCATCNRTWVALCWACGADEDEEEQHAEQQEVEQREVDDLLSKSKDCGLQRSAEEAAAYKVRPAGITLYNRFAYLSDDAESDEDTSAPQGDSAKTQAKATGPGPWGTGTCTRISALFAQVPWPWPLALAPGPGPGPGLALALALALASALAIRGRSGR